MSDKQTIESTTGVVSQRNESMDKNCRSRSLVHSVSIIVETVHDDEAAVVEEDPSDAKQRNSAITGVAEMTHDTDSSAGGRQQQFSRKERHQSSPIIFLEDHLVTESKKEGSANDESVQSIFATARMRKEAFARLLDEHAQLVDKINRAETSLI